MLASKKTHALAAADPLTRLFVFFLLYSARLALSPLVSLFSQEYLPLFT
jgi:hypothetical protein